MTASTSRRLPTTAGHTCSTAAVPPDLSRSSIRTHLAWADRTGNRQYITAGNLDRDDRVAIIAVDYPNRSRLKLLGHARFDPEPDPDTLAQLGIDGRLEALVTVEIVAFDWNCPKFITPRFTEDEVRAATEPLRARIAELEAVLATAGARR